MKNPDWSRRNLLKAAATGAVGLGLASAAVEESDRYIVGASSDTAVSAARSVTDAGYRKIDLGEYGTLIAGRYPGGVRQSLLSREDVHFVQPDRPLQAPPPGAGKEDGDGGAGQEGSSSDGSGADGQTLPWGIDRIDADVAHDDGETGDGAHVAIIDTGIDESHPDLADNLAEAGDGNHRAWEECDGDDCEHPWSDDGGHGTHVAGTVAAAEGSSGVVGVAPEVTLHALKVCNGAGFCSTSDIAAAIKYAADQGWDVANLSLGSPQESQALEAAGKYATDEGLLLVSSAGNEGPCSDCVGYPAAYDEFVAVSATSIDDSLAEFSSAGPEVELAAPGDEVCSSLPGSYGVFGGTSMASPHVAASAAHLVADDASNTEAREQLQETAEDVDLDDDEQGYGLVDAAAALGLDSSDDGTGDGTDCPS